MAEPPPPPTPPPPPPGRWSPLLVLLAVGGAVVGLTLLPFHGECGFRFVVGAPCPGCGMTRAFLALLRGDPGAAWRFHPMSFPSALAVATLLALALHEGFTGRPTFRRSADRHAVRAAVVGLALFAAVWAARVVWHPEWSPDPIRPGSPAARILR